MASEEVVSWGGLLHALLEAVEATGGLRVPAGREVEVGRLLNRVMTDPNLFTDYLRALATERDRRGLAKTLLTFPTGDIPEAQIVKSGFVGLDAVALAEIALSPEALKALEAVFHPADVAALPEFGDWYFRGPDGTDIRG